LNTVVILQVSKVKDFFFFFVEELFGFWKGRTLWRQSEAKAVLLYAFFWVISRRLNFYMPRFRKTHVYSIIGLWRWNRQSVRNVGI